ncbi:hypothetical protein [Mesobacterium pallidum]|uniref:hypothetical protein n=1 Tax=Mesobacterium pallidum TaxID=2872037 RepID=UPI001EE214F8|nr:hypothetical protein [Mesobacterium pallidum]
MTLPHRENWFLRHVAVIDAHYAGVPDRVGRPWSQHFERVALRMLFRFPQVSREALEAALYHDWLMAGGPGRAGLERAGLGTRAINLIDLVTPPPHNNHFRDMAAPTPEDTAVYFGYVQRIIDSGDIEAVHFKLADIRDTIDALHMLSDPDLKAQLTERYVPSVQMLATAAELR